MDGEGDSPIYCNGCDNEHWKLRREGKTPDFAIPVEAIDATPDEDLFDDEDL
jgi:hypothetical protein